MPQDNAPDESRDALDMGTPSAKSQRITNALLDTVAQIAEGCDAAMVFVYLDAVGGDRLPVPEALRERVIYVSKSPAQEHAQEDRKMRNLRVPNVPLTRMGQMKIATFLALSRGIISHGDIVVFLAGMAASGTLDTVIVTEVGREKEMLSSFPEDMRLPENIQPGVLERVVDIAVELGREGREGKPVGALFVVGDAERVESLSRQIIMNPFRGYPPEERNILDEGLVETIKELSTIDGAFIVRDDGVVQTCGAFLKTAGQAGEDNVKQGLGARHHAAAAISDVADCVAVAVSESTGNVSIFSGGRTLVEIEKAFRP